MNYGGQAVIEGVMMRSKKFMTIAVRLENGKLKIKRKRLNPVPFSNIYFLRGIFYLIDTVKVGIKSLNWSAEQQLEEDEKEAGAFLTIGASLISIIIAIILFKFLPLSVAKLINPSNLFLFNLIDGGIKLFIFIAYIWIISKFKDIARIFQFHGAEHKAIGCLEYNEELNVKNCKKYEKEHKRCGTNFLFIVIFVSIFVYLFIPLKMGLISNLSLRILLLPFIAAVSYEIIKLGGKYDNWFVKVISYPGILIQKLTTKEPNDEQLEVGILALKELIELDKNYK